jgi:hypothetical protein
MARSRRVDRRLDGVEIIVAGHVLARWLAAGRRVDRRLDGVEIIVASRVRA